MGSIQELMNWETPHLTQKGAQTSYTAQRHLYAEWDGAREATAE